MLIKKLILYGILLALSPRAFSQLTVNTTYSANTLVNSYLLGAGITAFNVNASSYTASMGYFVARNTTLGLSNGIMLTTGKAKNFCNSNNNTAESYQTNTGSDADLELVYNNLTYDKCFIEFDFIPQSDSVEFRYVFASEEYTEGVCTPYNDLFGFFITGPEYPVSTNIALVPGTTIAVGISSVNGGIMGDSIYMPDSTNAGCYLNNTVYFVDNTNNPYIEFDGMTKVLTAKAKVTRCETYHIKLVVAESGDGTFDSGVFIEGGSFKSDVIEVKSDPTVEGGQINGAAIEACGQIYIDVKRFDGNREKRMLSYSLTGDAIKDIDYKISPDVIVFEAGQGECVVVVTPLSDHFKEIMETCSLRINPDFVTCADYQPQLVGMKMTDSPPIDVIVTTDTSVSCGVLPVTLIAKSILSPFKKHSTRWMTESGQIFEGDTITYLALQTENLIVEMIDSCNQSKSRKEVHLNCQVYIPNSFTPNGDGLNDYYEIQYCNTVRNCTFKVYNRNGQIVYKSFDYKNTWNGDKLPTDIYVYVFTTPQDTEYRGVLHLIK